MSITELPSHHDGASRRGPERPRRQPNALPSTQPPEHDRRAGRMAAATLDSRAPATQGRRGLEPHLPEPRPPVTAPRPLEQVDRQTAISVLTRRGSDLSMMPAVKVVEGEEKKAEPKIQKSEPIASPVASSIGSAETRIEGQKSPILYENPTSTAEPGDVPQWRISERDETILLHAAEGEVARQSAKRLSLSENFIKQERAALCHKLGVTTIDGAVMAGLRQGVIEPKVVLGDFDKEALRTLTADERRIFDTLGKINPGDTRTPILAARAGVRISQVETMSRMLEKLRTINRTRTAAVSVAFRMTDEKVAVGMVKKEEARIEGLHQLAKDVGLSFVQVVKTGPDGIKKLMTKRADAQKYQRIKEREARGEITPQEAEKIAALAEEMRVPLDKAMDVGWRRLRDRRNHQGRPGSSSTKRSSGVELAAQRRHDSDRVLKRKADDRAAPLTPERRVLLEDLAREAGVTFVRAVELGAVQLRNTLAQRRRRARLRGE